VRHARGGSFVDGLGGDELFIWRRGRIPDLLAGRARPRPRDLRTLAATVAPAAVHRRFIPPQHVPTWLSHEGRAAYVRQWKQEATSIPVGWAGWLRCGLRRRYFTLLDRTFSILAEEAGTQHARPFLGSRTTGALAAVGGWRGFGSRNATLAALFGDFLPADVLARTTKTHCGEVQISDDFREAARRTIESGTIAFPELVEEPSSLLLLQASP